MKLELVSADSVGSLFNDRYRSIIAAACRLAAACERFTKELGHNVVLEKSDRSEAHYLHVERAGTWFGFRIACHPPVYACSKDYKQLLLDPEPSEFGEHSNEMLEHDRLFRCIAPLLIDGGAPVADPAEVEADLLKRRILKTMVFLDSKDCIDVFRGNETEVGEASEGLRELLASLADRERPADFTQEQRHVRSTLLKLSPQESSRVRHQHNQRARWVYDLSRPYSPEPTSPQ